MKDFDQFVQYRALQFKFSGIHHPGEIEESRVMKVQGDDGVFRPATIEDIVGVEVKNVCAKLPIPIVERLDNLLGVLDMTKRDFIEMALVDALDRVDAILGEVDAFEFVRQDQAGEPV